MNASEAQQAARALARGCYQMAIIDGSARVSGSDLKGAAAWWGCKYYRSRMTLLSRIREAGIPYQIGRSGKMHVIVWGDEG